MIELHVAYEDAFNMPRGLVRSCMDRIMRSSLEARGLSESDILSRETVMDGEQQTSTALNNGLQYASRHYLDKITIPGDE